MTLNLEQASCDPTGVSRQFQILRERHFGPWWRRPPRRSGITKRGPAAFYWVIEADGGLHVHRVLHMPSTRLADFKRRLPTWLAALGGRHAVDGDGLLDVGVVYNAYGLRKYLLKGTDPAYAAFCNDAIRHKPQGRVIGKRSGFSRSLGPAVRRRLSAAGAYVNGRLSRSTRRSFGLSAQ